MRAFNRFKTVGGLGIKFTQRRNLDKIKKWLKENPENVFESHHTSTWIENIDPLKASRYAGQTKREFDLLLKNPYFSPDPSRFTQFGEIKEMSRENDLSLERLREEFPKQVRLYKIAKTDEKDDIRFLSYNPEKEIVKWRFRDVKSGWNDEEVDLKTTLIMDGLKTGNYPEDDFKEVFEVQQFFEDRKLYEYYQRMKFTKEQKLPILLRGGGPGALQVGEEDTKIIFADTIKFTPGDIHNNDRLADMRKKYLAMSEDEKKWTNPIFPVASLYEQRRLGQNTTLVRNLFSYIEDHYPDFPEDLLYRLGVTFNDDGTVKLLAVMVRSFGYKKQLALPGLEHPNYRNIQLLGEKSDFKIIAPTNLVGSFAELVINADLFLHDRKLFDFTFAEASNTRYMAYLPRVQFEIRQMVKGLITPEKELLQWIDTEEFWTLLDKEINTNFRSLTSVPTKILDRQMILFEIYKQCTPVAALLKEKPDLEVQLKLLFMTFADKFQG